MFGYENINLTLSFNLVFFIISLLIVIAYSTYVYKYTLPPVSRLRRLLLVFVRILALTLLVFIIFEPTLVLIEKKILPPVSLFFIDNSKSMQIKDGSSRTEVVNHFIDEIINADVRGEKKFFSFGSEITAVKTDSLDNLNFTEPSTNFAQIIENVKNSDDNISTITIVSDGVITDGSTPFYSAQRLGIPFFNLAVGDSSRKKDIELKNVLFNDYIYAQTPTTINATITNNGFAGKSISTSLFEGSNLVSQKNIILDKSGVNSVSFEYTSVESGEKKIQLKVNALDGEASVLNNNKSFFINILDNKINILLIAGSPSADLTFIKNSLTEDPNLKVNTLTQVSPSRFLEQNQNLLLDSADIIYLIDYPNQNSENGFLTKVFNKLKTKNIPLFLLLSSDVSPSKLKAVEDLLPVSVTQIENNFLQVQPNPEFNELSNPLLNHSTKNDWNNLPPIPQALSNIKVKPESKVIVKTLVNGQPRNNPLVVTKNLGSKRSIVVLGSEIWRWKLQTAQKNNKLFDNFLLSSNRWLNAPDEDKKIKIKTSKKFYAVGEPIEFTGQVYDDLFNPLSDAEIKLNISGPEYHDEIILSSIGNGLYEGSVLLTKSGDYKFSGQVLFDKRNIGSDNGTFNVGDVDLELLESRMNFEFLEQLSNETNGKTYLNTSTDKLIEDLIRTNQDLSKEKILTSEIRLWSNEVLLILIIVLFSLEWFIRKRSGML
ncbi:MAG: hypothetical protein ROY99_08255 [Ignavibacterium sp.]|jgi:hypothetical protein|nr:hypothetical protein [Ignavibacterium sp.]